MKTGTVKDVMNDFKNGTYDFTNNGKCTQCGECCGNYLPMTAKEVEVIYNYIKVHNITDKSKCDLHTENSFNLICPFLDTKKEKEKCTIYKVRPEICRKFICDPKKRGKITKDYASRVRLVDLRKTFYGESGGMRDG